MARRRSLPVQHDVPARQPSVDAIRKRLGGRASTQPDAGRCVSIELRDGNEAVGVVLFASDDSIDVWIGEGRVHRVAPSRVRPVDEPPRTLAGVAGDARAFGALGEGERVHYDAGDGVEREATLVEKCRYGAILARDDGGLLGVGFRKVWARGTSGRDASN